MDMTDFQDTRSIKELLEALGGLGIYRLDSGARYPPLNPGRAEELLGETSELSHGFIIDTKVYTDTKNDGSGDLTKEAISKSTTASLHRLKAKNGVNVLHAHRADPSTSLEEQIEGFNQQIELGHCRSGDYNLVTRGMETRLLPILRAHNITYNAFRPLAAGFLTGKLVNGLHQGTRFADNNPLGKAAQGIFGAEDLRTATKEFDSKLKPYNISSVEVAIRWIAHHSALGDEDGIILGASKVEQIRQTVGMIKNGPLPEDVLDIAEGLWHAVKDSRSEII
ncbi:MAG: hypothetical protein L6R42_001296 [Xanthoria sp. 1 TBL-2021]|nr:MAG: hypothetical protein L6R42_001296 [Xanthoria sp. 1 TBL-2021]